MGPTGIGAVLRRIGAAALAGVLALSGTVALAPGTGAAGLPSGPGVIVDIDLIPSEAGSWRTSSTGEVFTSGSAPHFGDQPPLQAGELISGLTPTPAGGGYWLFSTLGRVFAFGDAEFFGDVPAVLGGTPLNGPVIDAVATPTGQGYYLLGFDGGVFSFGDARFFGSVPEVLPGVPLAAPIVGIAPTPTTQGYWLVAGDGGVFAFGDAGFVGSLPGVLGPGVLPNQPVIGLIPQGTRGYVMLASDGGLFSFGDTQFLGSLGGQAIPDPITAVAVTRAGDGYVMTDTRGRRYGFGRLSGLPSDPLLADTPAPTTPPPGGGAPLEEVVTTNFTYDRFFVRDPLVNDLEAYSFLAPRGWEVNAQVEWRFGVLPLAAPVVTVRNPESGSTLRSYFYPTRFENFITGLQLDARSLAIEFALQNVPNGTITVVEQIRPTYHVVRVAHTSGGQQLESDFYLDLSVFGTTPQTENFEARSAFSITAAAGSLDTATPFYMATVSSLDLDPQWYNAFAQVFQIFLQGVRTSQAQLSTFLQQFNDDQAQLNEQQMQLWRDREASYDRIFRDLGEWVRDETRVQLTNGSVATVPNTGLHCQVVGQPTIIIVQTQPFCPDQTVSLSPAP